jgi:hypothetical protein
MNCFFILTCKERDFFKKKYKQKKLFLQPIFKIFIYEENISYRSKRTDWF